MNREQLLLNVRVWLVSLIAFLAILFLSNQAWFAWTTFLVGIAGFVYSWRHRHDEEIQNANPGIIGFTIGMILAGAIWLIWH